MKHNNKLEQRTFLQDRFEILIKRQKAGLATFNELTELDEIVNKNAGIREIILEEMHAFNEPTDGIGQTDAGLVPAKQSRSFLDILRSFFSRMSFKSNTLYGQAYQLSF